MTRKKKQLSIMTGDYNQENLSDSINTSTVDLINKESTIVDLKYIESNQVSKESDGLSDLNSRVVSEPLQEVAQVASEGLEEVAQVVSEQLVEEDSNIALEPLKEVVEVVSEPLVEEVSSVALEPLVEEVSTLSLEPVKEVVEVVYEPLKEVVEVVSEQLKEVVEVVSEQLKEVVEVDSRLALKELQEVVPEPLDKVVEVDSAGALEPLKEVIEVDSSGALEPLKEVVEVDSTVVPKELQEVVEPDYTLASKELQEVVEPDSTLVSVGLEEVAEVVHEPFVELDSGVVSEPIDGNSNINFTNTLFNGNYYKILACEEIKRYHAVEKLIYNGKLCVKHTDPLTTNLFLGIAQNDAKPGEIVNVLISGITKISVRTNINLPLLKHNNNGQLSLIRDKNNKYITQTLQIPINKNDLLVLAGTTNDILVGPLTRYYHFNISNCRGLLSPYKSILITNNLIYNINYNDQNTILNQKANYGNKLIQVLDIDSNSGEIIGYLS